MRNAAPDRPQRPASILLPALALAVLFGCDAGAPSPPTPPTKTDDTIVERWDTGLPKHSVEQQPGPDGLAVKHGVEKRWYRNGRLQEQITWRSGRRHGERSRV